MVKLLTEPPQLMTKRQTIRLCQLNPGVFTFFFYQQTE